MQLTNDAVVGEIKNVLMDCRERFGVDLTEDQIKVLNDRVWELSATCVPYKLCTMFTSIEDALDPGWTLEQKWDILIYQMTGNHTWADHMNYTEEIIMRELKGFGLRRDKFIDLSPNHVRVIIERMYEKLIYSAITDRRGFSVWSASEMFTGDGDAQEYVWDFFWDTNRELLEHPLYGG